MDPAASSLSAGPTRAIRSRHALSLAAAVLLVLVGTARAAPEDSPQPPAPARPQSAKDILVPIPSASQDVAANGCHARPAPEADLADLSSEFAEVPFWRLINHAAGRFAVRLNLDDPDKFTARIAPLDDDMRRLVLLYTLWDAMGFRDGLQSFFNDKGGWAAPMMRDVLKGSGLTHEFDVMDRAIALFGEPYPADKDARDKFFASGTPSARLTVFDRRMLALVAEFGSRDTFARHIIDYVNRTPSLWQRIEGLREKLGAPERLRVLIAALESKVDIGKPYADIQRQLSLLTPEQRALFLIADFNDEFENGGVHQFFYNSDGVIAPDVYDAMITLGLPRQADIIKRGLAMFGAVYPRDTQARRDGFFHDGWNDWDEQLSALTNEFYALDGGPELRTIGPGIRDAMLRYAREHALLPC